MASASWWLVLASASSAHGLVNKPGAKTATYHYNLASNANYPVTTDSMQHWPTLCAIGKARHVQQLVNKCPLPRPCLHSLTVQTRQNGYWLNTDEKWKQDHYGGTNSLKLLKQTYKKKPKEKSLSTTFCLKWTYMYTHFPLQSATYSVL